MSYFLNKEENTLYYFIYLEYKSIYYIMKEKYIYSFAERSCFKI